ncbi:MAG: NADH-quinone oxidoreductase subunit J [Anaerolinea sp.]|nr:NADH-quinone oxidoreductase subunit J [Anaerolinea sp.]MCC6975416.1 NADH-quinone oxidoreductase subunit J [Anaerolineae bacterium]CAG0969621.1 NADH-quinone oxidoreductase subunit 10 [Anaerolineae bacterium]
MSAELVLFIVVAAVAIFAAALMLISRNAVHSALFLVINLLCVAFFYLMLNAPFLAMVQITVYAGAIMVLFMFVIMLLGAEKLGGGSTHYGWIPTASVILTTIFLIVAFVVVTQSGIGSLKPAPQTPEVRFVHAVDGMPAVDVYLNDQKMAEHLVFEEGTPLNKVRTGDYNLLVFAACPEGESECPDPLTSGAAPLMAAPFKVEPESTVTYVLAGTPTALRLISSPTDLSTLDSEGSWRLTVVNAMPDTGSLQFLQLHRSDPANPTVIVPALAYGEVSEVVVLPDGTYDFEFAQAGTRVAVIDALRIPRKTHQYLILGPEQVVMANGSIEVRPKAFAVAPVLKTIESFGGPQNVGKELLTTYLLGFEMVALLLLATMVGAIILAREEVVHRVRKRLVVSPVVKRMNQSITANAAAIQGEPTNTPAE